MIKCEYSYPSKKDGIPYLACENEAIGVCAYQYWCNTQRKPLNTTGCLECVERQRRLQDETKE